jgi:hypothetical protein
MLLVAQPNGELATLSNTSRSMAGYSAPATQAGVYSAAPGKVYDVFTIPPVLNYSTVSNNATGAGTVTQYIFNNTTLNAAVTTNGSGAASIVNTYGDGFSGRVYDKGVASWNGGRGVLIKGFTITSTTGSTGAQYSAAFATLNMQILNANSQGGVTPVPVDVSAALRNSQFQIGVLTVGFEFYLNSLNQLSLNLPRNTTFAITFVTENGSL